MDTAPVNPQTLERDIEQNRARLEHTLDELGERISFQHLSSELRQRLPDWQSAGRFVQRHPVPVTLSLLLAGAALVRRSRQRGWLHRGAEPTTRELVAALVERAVAASRQAKAATLESARSLPHQAADTAGDTLQRAGEAARHTGARLLHDGGEWTDRMQRAGEATRDVGGRLLHDGREWYAEVAALARREPVAFGLLAVLAGAVLRAACGRTRRRADR